jgi:PAS domain S-box-containing protein
VRAHSLAPATFVRRFSTWILLAAAYTLAGRLGLALALVNPSATAVWPPTGIALAAVLVLGPGVWPGIFLGAFLTNLLTAGSSVTSLLIASGNTLEALLTAFLVNRLAGRHAFDTPSRVVRFSIAGVAGAGVSATVGVCTLCVFGLAAWTEYGSIWITWLFGNAAGAIVLTPVILTWHDHPRFDWPRERRLELALLALTPAVIVGLFIIHFPYPLAFLTLPLCVWAGFRFGQREAATITCALAGVAVWSSTSGLTAAAAAEHHLKDPLLVAQTFIAIATTIGLSVSAAAAQRRRAEEDLRRSHADLETRVRARTRELQASEAQLKTIIDAEPACVKLVSGAGVLLEMNRAGLEMLGARDLSQVMGRPAAGLVHPDDRDRFLEMHRAVCAGLPQRLEFRIIGLTGQERWVDTRAVPFELPGESGEPQTAMLSVTSDITQHKRLEEALRQAQKMEAIGLLAGGIAHDFNNLLTAIAGNTDMVLMTLSEDDPRRLELEEIATAAQRAGGLTRQLLAVSRRQVLQPTVLDVNRMVAELQKLLRRTIPEHIDLQLDLSPVDSVRADCGQLEQVLLNLAINAGDAMPTGGTLRLATATVDVDEALSQMRTPMPPGRYVRLAVSDTGVGIEAAMQARIFEPFFTTKAAGKGTGLGLATVYGIVKQSGGFIWVDSEIGRGATFEVYLPVVNEPVTAAVETVAAPVVQGGSQTILLAEDDAAVRRLARDVLRSGGYTVLDADNGDAALALARKYPEAIHALVTDVVMPGLNGRDLARQLTADRPDVRVIYTSGYTENVMLRAGFEHSLTLLAKPFRPGDLLRKVNETLSK